MTTERRQQHAAASMRWYYRRATQRAAEGLTTRGTRPKYTRWPAVLSRTDRRRIERRDLVLAGFTTRGNPQRRRIAGGLDRNARARLRTAALNAIGLSARGKRKVVR
jgi:hypothetical protein